MYDNREDPLAEEDALKIPEGCEYFTTARSTGSTTHGKLGRHLMNHRKEKTKLYAMFPKLRKGHKEGNLIVACEDNDLIPTGKPCVHKKATKTGLSMFCDHEKRRTI